jgi:hypothetical protein
MDTTTVRTNLPAGTPEDLRAFAERLAELGVGVRLSPPVGRTTLPVLEELGGAPLSELVVRARRGE